MSEAYTSYLDFYRRGPYAPFVREHRLTGSAPVCLFDIQQPAGEYPDPPAPMFALHLVTGGKARAEFDMGAGRGSEFLRAGQIFLAPPDTATDYVLDGPSQLLATTIPTTAVRSAVEEVSPGLADFGRLHAAPFSDVLVEQLCRRMWEEATDAGALGAIFADYAVLALAAALLQLSGRPSQPDRDRNSGLAMWRLRRVRNFIEENLADDPSLRDLAQAAGLSPWHFARTLRQTTGISPVRYLQQCRVQRAKTLLTNTDLAIAEVALAVGFKNQEHFARVFRRLTGTTAASYRRTVRL